MILLASKEITICQSKQNVFRYVTNMENYGKWFPGVFSIRTLNDLPCDSVGKKYSETIQFPEGEVDLVIEVKACIENEKFYTEGDLPSLLPAMSMIFNELSGGETKLSLAYYSRQEELLSDSTSLAAIKKDLSERIDEAAKNLVALFN